IVNFYVLQLLEFCLNFRISNLECWKNDPNDRPSLQEVSKELNNVIAPSFHDIPFSDVPGFEIFINSSFNLAQTNKSEGMQEVIDDSTRQNSINNIVNASEGMQVVVDDSNQQNPMDDIVNAPEGIQEVDNDPIQQNLMDDSVNVPEGMQEIVVDSIQRSLMDKIVNELYSDFYKLFNEGKSVRDIIVNLISKHKKSGKEVYNWLSNHKDESKYVCLLGLFVSWHIGTDESNVAAFDLFLNAANKGDTIAQYFVGRCYDRGWNIKKNTEKSIDWYTKAAESGCAVAEYKLGDYYYKCENYSKAFELFQSSAEKGNVMAIHALGIFYYKGYGTDVDTDKGFKLFEQAANIGHPTSQYDLAKCYECKGTIEDLKNALSWYQKAINNNYNCYNERELVKLKIMNKPFT
ncbi:1180_t:CDS:1, partial [Cetraspora pellucida]